MNEKNKVKVLHYLNGSDDPSEHGQIMDTFVFPESADIEQIANDVQATWEESEGEKSYYDIITEKYGDVMLCIADSKEVVW